MLRAALTRGSAVARLARAGAVRAMATAVKPTKQAKDLLSVLSRELEYEKQPQGEGEETGLAGFAAAIGDEWKLVDESGKARFHLTKKFGTQELRIDVDCMPMPADEEEPYDEEEEQAPEGEEDETPQDGYRMLVSLRNPAKAKVMVIGCMVTDHLRIHRVTIYSDKDAPSPDRIFGGFDELPAYSGPNFDELDTALQNAFYEYLAERGVDDSLAQRVADYAAAKEQEEYVGFLKCAKDILS